MKEKLFKFRINNIEYGALMAGDLLAIEQLIGPYEVVKTRRTLLGLDRIIWVRKEETTDKKIVDEIKKVFEDKMFPEDREEYIYEIMKRYGKLN